MNKNIIIGVVGLVVVVSSALGYFLINSEEKENTNIVIAETKVDITEKKILGLKML